MILTAASLHSLFWQSARLLGDISVVKQSQQMVIEDDAENLARVTPLSKTAAVASVMLTAKDCHCVSSILGKAYPGHDEYFR